VKLRNVRSNKVIRNYV